MVLSRPPVLVFDEPADGSVVQAAFTLTEGEREVKEWMGGVQIK